MSEKMIPHSLIMFAVAFLFIVALSLSSFTPASAQCGTGQVTACENCHQMQTSSSSQNAWHNTHARKSACTDCHGGNATAPEKAQAHIGVFGNPLTDIYTNCHACHPSDYLERAGSFAKILNVTPSGLAAPATAQQVSSNKPANILIVQTDDANKPTTDITLPSAMILAGGGVIALVFALLAFMNLWHRAH